MLGPGLRMAFWLSGCNFRCAGCIDPAQWDQKAGKPVKVSELLEACSEMVSGVAGVTFSGGEPLLQAKGLLSFLECLPQRTDRMLFTGFRHDEMSNLQREVWGKMDISVEGRFVQEEAGDFLWRGSANKVICSPTGKYDGPTIERWMHSPSAGISVSLSGERVYFYGVPKKGSLEKMKDELAKREILLNLSD